MDEIGIGEDDIAIISFGEDLAAATFFWEKQFGS